MLLLCSDGLTNQKLIEYVKNQKGKRAAVVVTADHEYKENNYHIPRVIDELTQCNLVSELFDIDFQPACKLLDYDVVMFIGGNPYYLLQSLRKSHAKPILKEIVEKKCLIGWSAGAVVMGPTIKIIDEYSPEMNLWGVQDLTGMELTNMQILPHYNKFMKRYDRFEERCLEYERQNNCTVIRLNDGDGIIA